MKFPSTRKERLKWLEKKKGMDYVMTMYTLTDREVKQWFNSVYPIYKDAPDYVPTIHDIECLVCGGDVITTWTCACGDNMAIIDENDPELEQRMNDMKGR
ncbi:hypothetical protein M5X17_31090 [Paenibacillus alvei]|uniref:hypothetical protein n=1 Tax=Paenibacillus alvei TaxID=44250 RepID=UPI00227F8DF0|nr:hypothetical protein [Paenibacillus alvei]MCY9738139.1 hypothetical protein [Paenibacillus alvei]